METPTAKQIIKKDESGVFNEQDIAHMMIEFTKLHVKAALQAAADNVEFDEEVLIRQSILQAYPEDNIK